VSRKGPTATATSRAVGATKCHLRRRPGAGRGGSAAPPVSTWSPAGAVTVTAVAATADVAVSPGSGEAGSRVQPTVGCQASIGCALAHQAVRPSEPIRSQLGDGRRTVKSRSAVIGEPDRCDADSGMVSNVPWVPGRPPADAKWKPVSPLTLARCTVNDAWTRPPSGPFGHSRKTSSCTARSGRKTTCSRPVTVRWSALTSKSNVTTGRFGSGGRYWVHDLAGRGVAGAGRAGRAGEDTSQLVPATPPTRRGKTNRNARWRGPHHRDLSDRTAPILTVPGPIRHAAACPARTPPNATFPLV